MKEIAIYPNPVLLQVADKYNFNEKISKTLVKEMFNIMINNNGVGLAGPQIGLSKRIIVYLNPYKNSKECLINPTYLPLNDEVNYMEEGCLSLPGTCLKIKRHTNILVTGFTHDWKALKFKSSDLLARIIQHEIDHLNGITLYEKDFITQKEF